MNKSNKTTAKARKTTTNDAFAAWLRAMPKLGEEPTVSFKVKLAPHIWSQCLVVMAKRKCTLDELAGMLFESEELQELYSA